MAGKLTSLVERLRDRIFVLYVLASVCALAVDVGSFLALMAAGISATLASAIGYSLGIVSHWLLSSRTVFTGRVADRGTTDRTRQKALFVGSALAGLALTTAIVGAGELSGIDPRAAKLVAIGASFLLTWVLRSRIVFRTEG
ncbi:GtrA family protein [Erythrobacter sp. SDW2]|uniref:GtrA family protein n=1 Tax=Erythrobacter sp. SDW2 TaxID=2907154 RepID=UPI001F2FD857|nr:GtrA family protein [Erythrobacter sp. SDW2]UIP07213.1 GtrA family protein [Erythrobacter sp. SDW2]